MNPNNSIYQTKILNLYSFSNISYVHEKSLDLKAFYNPFHYKVFTLLPTVSSYTPYSTTAIPQGTFSHVRTQILFIVTSYEFLFVIQSIYLLTCILVISLYYCFYNYFNYLKNLSKFQKLHPYSIKYHHFEE